MVFEQIFTNHESHSCLLVNKHGTCSSSSFVFIFYSKVDWAAFQRANKHFVSGIMQCFSYNSSFSNAIRGLEGLIFTSINSWKLRMNVLLVTIFAVVLVLVSIVRIPMCNAKSRTKKKTFLVTDTAGIWPSRTENLWARERRVDLTDQRIFGRVRDVEGKHRNESKQYASKHCVRPTKYELEWYCSS